MESGFHMLLYKDRILITGGSGRFGQVFKSQSNNFRYNFFFSIKKKFKYLKHKIDRKIYQENKT